MRYLPRLPGPGGTAGLAVLAATGLAALLAGTVGFAVNGTACGT